MNNVVRVAVGLGVTILLFAITYEYTKLKKGHTNNDNGSDSESLGSRCATRAVAEVPPNLK